MAFTSWSCDVQVPSRFAESARRLDHSLSEANLQSLSTCSRSLEGSQGDSTQSGAKRRVFRHSLSGKGTPSGGLNAQASYTSRYATRQVSGRSSPVHSDTASSGKRSLISSPATSVHGGQDPLMQSFGKSNKASTAVAADSGSGATLAGAAAVLKSHVRPSASEGVGWHLATGDGLPFSPRGSLVASSGGSRTLRPITSQQEALFDADGNQLPRYQAQPLQSDLEVLPEGTAAPLAAAKTSPPAKGKTPSQQGDSQSQADLIGVNAAKQKSKHSMLSIIAFPCFCMRPTPTSAEDPFTHGSLRERFAAKDATGKDAAAQKQFNSKATKPALKQKGQSNNALLTEASRADWDLGTHVEAADAAAPSKWNTNEWQTAQAVDESLGEAKGPGLQGAVSLAPKRALDGSKAHVSSQEVCICWLL